MQMNEYHSSTNFLGHIHSMFRIKYQTNFAFSSSRNTTSQQLFTLYSLNASHKISNQSFASTSLSKTLR